VKKRKLLRAPPGRSSLTTGWGPLVGWYIWTCHSENTTRTLMFTFWTWCRRKHEDAIRRPDLMQFGGLRNREHSLLFRGTRATRYFGVQPLCSLRAFKTVTLASIKCFKWNFKSYKQKTTPWSSVLIGDGKISFSLTQSEKDFAWVSLQPVNLHVEHFSRLPFWTVKLQ